METLQARKWRWLIFASASIETFLFGGILFGWGSLVYVLKQDGIFSHLCASLTVLNSTKTVDDVNLNASYHSNSATSSDDALAATVSTSQWGWVTCEAQDKMLSLCFSITVTSLYCTTSVIGALSYKLGTRTTRLIGWFSFTCGSLFTAFASPGNPWLLFAGLPPLGFGGMVLVVTNFQVGTLFDKGSATVIAMVSGLMDSSSVVMLFLKFAHESGFSRRDFVLVLCGLHCLSLLNTLLLMPRAHFTWTSHEADHDHTTVVAVEAEPLNQLGQGQELTEDSTISKCTQSHDVDDNNDYANDHIDDNATVTTESRQRPVPTLKQCVLSTMFIMEVAWMALLQLRFSFFLASLNPWLLHRFHGQNQPVSHFTNVSLYSMMCGLLISFMSGAAFDFFKHVFAKHPVKELRCLFPAVILLAVTCGLGVGLSVSVLLPYTVSLYASFVLAALLRSFIYSVDANVIIHVFPPQYNVALFGVSDMVGGALSLLQHPLVVWCQSAGFLTVNWVMLVVAAVSAVHPVVQWWRGMTRGRGGRNHNQHCDNCPGVKTPHTDTDTHGVSATPMATDVL